MDSKAPKLIIFDLDDTLAPASSIYDEAMHFLGVYPDDPIFLEARRQVKESLPRLAPVARSRFLYFKKFLELKGQYKAGLHFEMSEKYENFVVNQMADAWNRLKRNDLMKDLRGRGFKLVVLSNETCRFQTRKLSQFEGENHFFESLLTSEERAVEKPTLSLFQEVLSKFTVESTNALMVGDSWQNDIEPCLKLGLPSVQTLEFIESSPVHNRAIRDLNQIIQYV